MQPDVSPVEAVLETRDVDGYLLNADSDDPNQRYLSGFDAPDPFVTLFAGDIHLLVSSLEFGRAKSESHAATVARFSDFNLREKRSEYGSAEAFSRTVASFLRSQDVESIVVPSRFPISLADGLRDLGIRVVVDADDDTAEMRAQKTDDEIEKIRRAQKANEAAMAHAESILSESSIDGETLVYKGSVLTSERLRREIEFELLENDHALDETIVACGSDGADPHDRGSGPLAPDESIVIDIFPRGKDTDYFADMTRTFVKGTPTPAIEEYYELTERAKAAAIDAIEPGVTGESVHNVVCDVYEDAGYPTLRSDPQTETGFIHSTGHGVGLDVHEGPALSPVGETLKPGHVITIEPGLYDPSVGGVRIEDIGVVTEDGFENLTTYPQQLRLD
ncbi:Xaa-Pro peptidase family protein [Halocatena halophila]|uniref:Xaa-Pro peptidase family protein n=1 Tax=Halocatena halophila TaxID=2814576 RepID=UPI002ED698A5